MEAKKKRIIRLSLIALGIMCIALGIYRREVETVFHKAAQICMECVGIG